LEVITSHKNADFDAFASILAAKKLYPDALMVLSGSQNQNVRDFISLHSDVLKFVDVKDVDLSYIKKLIVVDTKIAKRLGDFEKVALNPDVEVVIFDHHPPSQEDMKIDIDFSRQLGSTTTSIVALIRERGILITPFEATVFAMGIHEDTGSLTYSTTTYLDVETVAFLMAQRANIKVIRKFLNLTLTKQQHKLLEELISKSKIVRIKDVDILMSHVETSEFVNGFSVLAHKLGDLEEADITFIYAKMRDRIYIVARSKRDDVDVGKIISYFNGGGHPTAASASVKGMTLHDIEKKLIEQISNEIEAPLTAKDIMSTVVKTISEKTTIKEAEEKMVLYGHSGLPVIKRGKIIGIISRKDIDKAIRHKLSHAPVKGFMLKRIITASPDTTVKYLQKTMIENAIGRIPILDVSKLVGIVTRKDILRAQHGDEYMPENNLLITSHSFTPETIRKRMTQLLPKWLIKVIDDLGELADKHNIKTYLVGGFVRDMLLKYPNLDIDVVVEGDGITFAKKVVKKFDGRIRPHKKFGTAVVVLPNDFHIDFTSARSEYYEHPAALPSVENSSIYQDLYRRDFSVNSMAIALNKKNFGQILDFFGGQRDILEKRIKIMHNLSFIEDPTRIFRAVRFEQRYGFCMDSQTENLARNAIGMKLVDELTTSRVREELVALFSESKSWRVVMRLDNLKALRTVHPQLKSTPYVIKRLKEIQSSFYKLSDEFSQKPLLWIVNMIGLFYDIPLNEAEKWCSKMKMKKKFADKIIQGVSEIKDRVKSLKRKKIKNSQIYKILNELYSESIIVIYALFPNVGNKIEKYINELKDVKISCTGQDLINIGFKPSPFFKEVLNSLLEAKLDGLIKDKNDEILFIKNEMNKTH